MRRCTILGNDAYRTLAHYPYGGLGGGASIDSGTDQFSRMILEDCIIQGNTANGTGGVRLGPPLAGPDNGSFVSLIRCKIIGNSSRGFDFWGPFPPHSFILAAGGVSLGNVSSDIRDCLIQGNTGFGGGIVGLANSDTSLHVSGCTIVDNVAVPQPSDGDSFGGGMVIYNIPDMSEFLVENSLLWGNTADYGSQIAIEQGYLSVAHSNIQGGQEDVYLSDSFYYTEIEWGEGNINADPLFAADGYHLQRRSPCVNAGDPAYVPSPGETDIDGEMRVYGGRVDMGADEWQPIMIPPDELDPAPMEAEPIELPPGQGIPLP